MQGENVLEKASEEKEFLEELEQEVCAIRNMAGEIIKRIGELLKKVEDHKSGKQPRIKGL